MGKTLVNDVRDNWPVSTVYLTNPDVKSDDWSRGLDCQWYPTSAF